VGEEREREREREIKGEKERERERQREREREREGEAYSEKPVTNCLFGLGRRRERDATQKNGQHLQKQFPKKQLMVTHYAEIT
jgi:hypothetical protein